MFDVEDIVNIEVIKELLYNIFNEGWGDKIPLELTDFFQKKTFLTIFYKRPSLESIPKTIKAKLLRLDWEFLDRCLLVYIFIFGFYIFEFTNPNLISYDFADYFCILDIFDNDNNTSKIEPTREAIVSTRIEQFHELVYNLIMHLNIII